MSNHNTLQERARSEARELLARSPSFQSMSWDEKMSLYKEMVNASYQKLAEQNGLSAQLGRKGASRDIDERRHENRRIDQAGDLAGSFIENVDFPQFVKDLLEGVFEANLKVTLDQMESYVDLLKAATASVSKFINAIDDTAAFGYLAEHNDDEFGLSFDDDNGEKDENGETQPVLVDKNGEPVDIGDNAVKAKIMEAKIKMAQEQRALLRETILMGVSRLVIEEGLVESEAVFDIKASEKIQKKDKAARKKAVAKSGSISRGGGFLGSIFGGTTGGSTYSNKKTKISISSASSNSTTDLRAKLKGKVSIKFKSDYFKLDNFADMYGQIKEEDTQATPAEAKQ